MSIYGSIEVIKALAEIVSEHDLTCIEVDEKGKIKIEKAAKSVEKVDKSASVSVNPVFGSISAEAPSAAPVAATSSVAAEAAPVAEEAVVAGANDVTSPLVGTFYSAPSPDAEPFVTIGDKVKAGDVLCVIEAMKLMNEITAEQDGEIVDICIKNGDIAEFGQILFKMK